MSEVQEIAGRLDAQQRHSLAAIGEGWRPGPALAEEVLPGLKPLRELGLVEREFGDVGSPKIQATDGSLTYRLSACWWFRRTDLGEAVRAHLQATKEK